MTVLPVVFTYPLVASWRGMWVFKLKALPHQCFPATMYITVFDVATGDMVIPELVEFGSDHVTLWLPGPMSYRVHLVS